MLVFDSGQTYARNFWTAKYDIKVGSKLLAE